MHTLKSFAQVVARHSIGTKHIVDALAQNTNYPVFSVERPTDHGWTLALSVAGYHREDLSVTLDSDLLIIEGHGTPAFAKWFALGRGVDVVSARFTHGLVIIQLERRPTDPVTKIINLSTSSVIADTAEADQNSPIHRQSGSASSAVVVTDRAAQTPEQMVRIPVVVAHDVVTFRIEDTPDEVIAALERELGISG